MCNTPRKGNSSGLQAIETKYGWSLNGPISDSLNVDLNSTSNKESSMDPRHGDTNSDSYSYRNYRKK